MNESEPTNEPEIDATFDETPPSEPPPSDPSAQAFAEALRDAIAASTKNRAMRVHLDLDGGADDVRAVFDRLGGGTKAPDGASCNDTGLGTMWAKFVETLTKGGEGKPFVIPAKGDFSVEWDAKGLDVNGSIRAADGRSLGKIVMVFTKAESPRKIRGPERKTRADKGRPHRKPRAKAPTPPPTPPPVEPLDPTSIP